MKSVKKYALDKLIKFIKVGGKTVTNEQAEARKDVCKGCEFFGEVEPLPKLKMDGCQKCGCPSATKAHMKTIHRAIGKENEPLSITEMLKLKTKGLLGNQETFEQIIKCPHPDGNKWEKADEKFLKSKS